MAFELVYTSAQEGLKTGSRGFCTVACTRGLPLPMATMLESLSGYRQLYSPGSDQENLNPVVYSHFFYQNGGVPLHLLSRISPAGLDYSSRPNKICHHLALKSDDLVPGGPAAVCSEPDLFIEKWDSPPTLFDRQRSIPMVQRSPAICHQWQDQMSDPGWAGVLAASIEANRPVCLLFSPGIQILPLFDEAIALLPKAIRWEATFTTFFTRLPAGIACQWKCVLAGSAEEGQVRAVPNIIVIDLNKRVPVPENTYSGPVFHKYLQMARDGIIPRPVTGLVPVEDTPAAPSPVEMVPPEFYSEHSESGTVLTGSDPNGDAEFLKNLELSESDGKRQSPPPINNLFSPDVSIPPTYSSSDFPQIDTELSSIPVPKGKKSWKKSGNPVPWKFIVRLLLSFLLMAGTTTAGYLVGRNNGMKIGKETAIREMQSKAPVAPVAAPVPAPPATKPVTPVPKSDVPASPAKQPATPTSPAKQPAAPTSPTKQPATPASPAKQSAAPTSPAKQSTAPAAVPAPTPAVVPKSTAPAKEAGQKAVVPAKDGNMVILEKVQPVLDALSQIRLSSKSKEFVLDDEKTKTQCKEFCKLLHNKQYKLDLVVDPLIKLKEHSLEPRYEGDMPEGKNEITVIVTESNKEESLFVFIIGENGIKVSCPAKDDNRWVANLFLFSFLKWTVLDKNTKNVKSSEGNQFYQTVMNEEDIICDYNAFWKKPEDKPKDVKPIKSDSRSKRVKEFIGKFIGDTDDDKKNWTISNKVQKIWEISNEFHKIDKWNENIPIELEFRAVFIQDEKTVITNAVNITQTNTKNTAKFYCVLKNDEYNIGKVPFLDV